MESSPSSSKKAKALGNIAQVAHCLVDGCSADLSLCRDYHRRHKVCEAHSKTPKVTIGGREQRFCQQCSRFHSLVEFDEGKRSCRKRLDGHNRRRRKPQPECHPRGSGQGTTRLVSFSSSPQILGSSVVGYSWSGVVKPEHEMGVVCNNQQVQLNYMETGSRYKGVSEVGIQEGSMFVDPSQRMFDSDGALSLLSSGTPAPREFGSRHDHYHHHHHHDHVPQTKQVIDYNGVGVGAGAGAGAGQYEESKGEEASPASSVSTFHFPEMFQQGMGSSTHQTLSFMWE